MLQNRSENMKSKWILKSICINCLIDIELQSCYEVNIQLINIYYEGFMTFSDAYSCPDCDMFLCRSFMAPECDQCMVWINVNVAPSITLAQYFSQHLRIFGLKDTERFTSAKVKREESHHPPRDIDSVHPLEQSSIILLLSIVTIVTSDTRY